MTSGSNDKQLSSDSKVPLSSLILFSSQQTLIHTHRSHQRGFQQKQAAVFSERKKQTLYDTCPAPNGSQLASD